jgi:hypothetical protein
MVGGGCAIVTRRMRAWCLYVRKLRSSFLQAAALMSFRGFRLIGLGGLASLGADHGWPSIPAPDVQRFHHPKPRQRGVWSEREPKDGLLLWTCMLAVGEKSSLFLVMRLGFALIGVELDCSILLESAADETPSTIA